MTLRHFGDKKKDAQMADYEQAIVQLGLKKAEAERELEAKRRELKNVSTSCDLVRSVFMKNFERLTDDEKKELKEKSGRLLDFDEKAEREEKEILRLTAKRQSVETDVAGAAARLRGIEEDIRRAESIREAAQGDANRLLSMKSEKEKDAILAVQEASGARKELADVVESVSEAQRAKALVDAETEDRRRELEELNEIISVLHATNKEGLDLVASFEGERRRLADKERIVDAARRDLLVYAKRLQGEREKAGIKTPMVLPPGL